MKKGFSKKALLAMGMVLLLSTIVLSVHIYLVTRHKAPDANTLVMARIDLKQPITKEDASKITAWLYQQKGVDHVLCNPDSRITVFSFYPVKTSADDIVANFKYGLNYKAERFVPSKNQVQSGCPVAATSFTYKAYKALNNLF
jgi:hypothetical protein